MKIAEAMKNSKILVVFSSADHSNHRVMSRGKTDFSVWDNWKRVYQGPSEDDAVAALLGEQNKQGG